VLLHLLRSSDLSCIMAGGLILSKSRMLYLKELVSIIIDICRLLKTMFRLTTHLPSFSLKDGPFISFSLHNV
jgi:hypothetical protein